MAIRLFILAIFTFSCGATSFASHPYQLVRQKRPKHIDTSTTAKSEGGSISASYVSKPNTIPLNSIHSWTLSITAKDGTPLENAEVVLSGDMPEHLHGMTTRPKITKLSKPGQFLVEGMNFHMPGWWEITLDITGGGSRDLVRFHLLVGEGKPTKHAHCPICIKKEMQEKARLAQKKAISKR